MKSLDYPDSAKIVHVGKLIKRSTSRSWLVSVKTFPPMKERKTDVFSTLPELARGRIINQTKRVADDRVPITFAVPDVSNVAETKLGIFPEIYPHSSYIENIESEQYAFSIPTSLNGSVVNVLIPELEMARVTILQFSYLCRACMNSTSLLVDFDVSYNDEEDLLTIDVINSKVFPKSALQSVGLRNLLAWLLFDNSAMLSFKSIYQNLQKEMSEQGEWDAWLFRFDLPDISGWDFDCLGRYNDDQSMFIVDEIIGVKIANEMPNTIRYQGRGFTENINRNEPSPPEQVTNSSNTRAYELDADAMPNDEYVEHFSNTSLTVNFKSTFSSEVIREPRLLTNSDKSGEARDKNDDVRRASTSEPTVMGNDKPISVGVTRDPEEQQRQLKNRFKLFSKVVDSLAKMPQITIKERDIFEKLKPVGRSRLHKLSDGRTVRSIQSVLFAYKVGNRVKDFIILEVDVSDGISPLSTLILPAFDENEWQKIYESIRYELVKNSLKWPKSHLSSICQRTGRNYRTAIHPKSDLLSMEDDRAAVSSWTRNIYSKLY